MTPEFDLIVVGAGHAGCEAALAAARMGLRTLLLTGNVDRIGHLSCNPAVGGLGKGHMVREIDALGGSMGRWADEAAIQSRTLNAAKGPAVRATRHQVDRDVYMAAVKRDIFGARNLLVREETVEDILTETDARAEAGQRAAGVRTTLGQNFRAPAVLLTTGTFLQGRIHIGSLNYPGGRRGDDAALGLSASLERLGLRLARFMTCTTPRILTASVDFSRMEPQPGDTPPPRFSWLSRSEAAGPDGQGQPGGPGGPGGWSAIPSLPQQNCWLTWTNERTHEVIREYLGASPMYSGAIPGAGPRYCPSIEDKIARFPEKERHQIFVEPEGVNHPETYPNNVPTGLPLEAQIALLRTIPGLERCHVVRPGYAIEYDMLPPTQLAPTLEVKTVPGLWSAGQINGTSGYEEAAAQGLWAALNIVARLRDLPPFLPGRDAAYMAVLTDDLATRGTDEPYRMFTSRAEHRLLLRESNAEERLTPLGRRYGLVGDAQWQWFEKRRAALEDLVRRLETERVTPSPVLRAFFAGLGEPAPANAMPLGELFRRPAVTPEALAGLWPAFGEYPEDVRQEAEMRFRYAGYVRRQEELALRMRESESVRLPETLDYAVVAGLTAEAREKLAAVRPRTLGQASRIPGITPAAVACLEIQLSKLSRNRNASGQ